MILPPKKQLRWFFVMREAIGVMSFSSKSVGPLLIR
jgi:hypothetical protein